MASIESIEKFEEENGVDFNEQFIKDSIERILTITNVNKDRELSIGKLIKSEYPKIAKEYERQRGQETILKTGNAAKPAYWDLFANYVAIISEIVNETSERLVNQSKANIESAQLTVEKATKDLDEVKKLEEAAIEKEKNWQKGEKHQNLKGYKEQTEQYETALKIAKSKQESLVAVEPYEGSMDYFGISGEEAQTMFEKQANSYTYKDARQFQIGLLGVDAPLFKNELDNAVNALASAIDGQRTYHSATLDEKKCMQEMFVTKELMKEKLESKNNFKGWFWKLWHRSETKAMKNYIKTAESKLNALGFDETAVKETKDAMEKTGYLYGDYNAAETKTVVDREFANNEKVYAPKRAYREDIKATGKLPLEDQFFRIGFKPDGNIDKVNTQLKAFNEVHKKYVKDNPNIPKDVYNVFLANFKKFRDIQDLSKKQQGTISARQVYDICEKHAEAVMEKVSILDYKPMTFAEVEKSRPHVEVQMNDHAVETNVVSQKIVEAPQKEGPEAIK